MSTKRNWLWPLLLLLVLLTQPCWAPSPAMGRGHHILRMVSVGEIAISRTELVTERLHVGVVSRVQVVCVWHISIVTIGKVA